MTTRKHIATGKPMGRPKLNPERLVACRSCESMIPFSKLSKSGLCAGCSLYRAHQAAKQMHDKKGFIYQRWLDATAKGRIAIGSGK